MNKREFLKSLLLLPFATASLVNAQSQEDLSRITAEELISKIGRGEKVTIIDVRSEGQYKAGANRIKGDIRMPSFEEPDIASALKEIPKDQLLVAYCTCPDEASSLYLVEILKKLGYKNSFALKGGYYAWVRVDGPIEPRP